MCRYHDTQHQKEIELNNLVIKTRERKAWSQPGKFLEDRLR